MNAHAGDLVSAGRKARSLRPWLGAGAVAALGACASNPLADKPVDPSSPVAAQVSALAGAGRPYPEFSQIPKRPDDERPVQVWAGAVADIHATGEALASQTAPETWTLHNTETFAATAQAAVADEPDFERAGGDTETFAREQRERATPPPPAR